MGCGACVVRAWCVRLPELISGFAQVASLGSKALRGLTTHLFYHCIPRILVTIMTNLLQAFEILLRGFDLALQARQLLL